MLKNRDIDVILLDMNLGVTDGISVLKEIWDAGYDAPIIMLSGAISYIDMDKVKDMGVVYAMEKSFDNTKLFQLIGDITGCLAT